jgi:hypothetical protein
MNRRFSIKQAVTSATLALAGIGLGVAVASSGSASAADSSTTATSAASSGTSASGKGDGSTSVRADEKLLTGTTASKVKAAALATSPGATIQRVETDSDGVYEAHIVTADGSELIVQVGKDFTVTGTDTRGGHGGDTPDDAAA